jgi:uncharacterized protein (TIGR02996 family)
MGLKDELLRAVRENPEDMAARVALADWLQENAEADKERAYGEYLALCAQRAQLPPDHPGREAMEPRRFRLLALYREEWLGPLTRLGDVEVRPDGFVALTGYNLGLVTKLLPALEGEPEFAWVVECGLRLCARPDGPETVQTLAASPRLAHLTDLRLQDNGLSAANIGFLAASPHAGRLTELHLGGNALGDAGVSVLTASPVLTRLIVLDLSRNGLGPEGARALAAGPRTAQLRTLSLWGNRIGEEGALALAGSPRVAGLTTLDLGGNLTGDAGARALASSRHLGRLATLDLRSNRIGAEGAQALARSRSLPARCRLFLYGNDVGAAREALRARFGDSVFF